MRTAPQSCEKHLPPSAASERETGLGEPVAGWRQCTICPAHAVTAQALPPYGVLHRVGAVAQPGHEDATCAETHTVSPGLPPLQRLCAAVRTHVYGIGQSAWGRRARMGGVWVLMDLQTGLRLGFGKPPPRTQTQGNSKIGSCRTCANYPLGTCGVGRSTALQSLSVETEH